MVQCSFTAQEQQVMAAFGDYLLIDEEVSNRMSIGIFDSETENLAKRFIEAEKRYHHLKDELPPDSRLFQGTIWH